MREEQELSAAMERVLKLADYLVSVPTDHYTRRPPHPYEGHPSCANRQAADDLRTVLHATRSNPPQEERSDPLGLAAADDNRLVEALRKCRDQFGLYAQLYAQKGTPEGDAKFQTNHDMALMCAQALAPFTTKETDHG